MQLARKEEVLALLDKGLKVGAPQPAVTVRFSIAVAGTPAYLRVGAPCKGLPAGRHPVHVNVVQ
jgi:hypothetical protein